MHPKYARVKVHKSMQCNTHIHPVRNVASLDFFGLPNWCAMLACCSYMYLAVTLNRLDDFDNACAAYEKAIQMAGTPGEPVFHLNYGRLEVPRL